MFSVKSWQEGKKWANWSGNYTAYPGHFYAPHTIEELCHIVKQHAQAKKTIRVTGAAHSFSPVALPEQSALTLHNIRGLIEVDKDNYTATFYAGTYLHEIGPLLATYGLGLINMGDIHAQTLAGVIATGTHGTGVTLGSFSAMVEMWGFVNGQGDYIEHMRGEDDLSQALHVSVGLLGVLVKVKIKVVPLYSLSYQSKRENLTQQLAIFQEEIRVHRHVEWYYFPGSELIQVKTMDQAPLQKQSRIQTWLEQSQLQLVENGAFFIVSELCKWNPKWSSAVSRLSSHIISENQRTDLSYAIFPSARSVKFVETEWAIPLQQFEACMEEIHATFTRKQFDVHFPIECRTTAGESGFLSPTQGEESAFIAFHMYKGMDETRYFSWINDMMMAYGGRAHWGKVNPYNAQNIAHYYPNIEKFNQQRQIHDPQNVWLTTYFHNIFKGNRSK